MKNLVIIERLCYNILWICVSWRDTKWGASMAVSYKKLFKLMIDKNMRKKDLVQAAHISYSTLEKLDDGANVQMDVIERVCRAMECTVDDIVEFLPDDASPENRTDDLVR